MCVPDRIGRREITRVREGAMLAVHVRRRRVTDPARASRAAPANQLSALTQ